MPRRLRDSLDILNENPAKHVRRSRPAVHYKDILVNAFEYYQNEAMASVDSLVPRTHMDALQTRAKRKTEGDASAPNKRKQMDLFARWQEGRC